MYLRIQSMFILGLLTWAVLPLSGQDRLAEIRKAIHEKGAQWEACENAVSTLPPAARRRLLGAKRPSTQLAKARQITLPALADLPTALDWRDNNGNWVTPVKAQGACGSCWDFSAIAQVESWWMIYHQRPDSLPDLSEQYILCAADAGDCTGGGVETALTFIQENGVPPEAYFAYQADETLSCPPGLDQWAEQMTTFPDWGYVTLGEADVDLIKQAVMRHPVSVTYTVFADFYSYQSGIYEHVTGAEEGGHAVLIVGWDDADRCWIVKNSWGPNWGENGYFRIRWGECGMGTEIPFIYDHHTANAQVTASQTVLALSLTQGETYRGSVTLENPSSEAVEFSLIDDQVPRVIHSSKLNAYEGQSIWFADPDLRGYDDHWLLRLDLPPFDLSQAAAPVFSLQANWNIEALGVNGPYDGWDGWNVWVSMDDGENFEVLTPENIEYNAQSMWSFGDADQGWGYGPGIPGWGGSSSGWQEIRFNLSAFIAQPRVQLRIAFASDKAFCSRDDATVFGLLVDDLRVTDGGTTLYSHTGDNLEGMTQRSLGSQPAAWLTLGLARGVLPPGGLVEVPFTVETGALTHSEYEGLIHVEMSDAAQPQLSIPIRLTLTTAVDETSAAPERLTLLPAYPNPFNQGTVLSVTVPQGGAEASVKIYDALGREVCTLHSGRLSEGNQNFYWDGRDGAGRTLSSGVYLVVLQAGNRRVSRKICQVK